MGASLLHPCWLAWVAVFLLLSLLSLPAQEADEASTLPAPRLPDRQELWIPTEQLDAILKKHPDAVMLSAEEYEALVRDAGRVPPESSENAKPPPHPTVVEDLHLSGKVTEGTGSVTLRGVLTVSALAEGWSRIELPWPLAMRHARGDAGLLAHVERAEPRPDKRSQLTPPRLQLFVRGPGRHRLRFEAEVPLQRTALPGGSVLALREMGCRGRLELELPPGVSLLRATPHRRAGDKLLLAFDAQTSPPKRPALRYEPPFSAPLEMPPPLIAGEALRVEWMGFEMASAPADAAFSWQAEAGASHQIGDSGIESLLALGVKALTPHAGEVGLRLHPASAEVLAVEGWAVTSWRQEGDRLWVSLEASPYNRLFQLRLRAPPAEDDSGWTDLPHVIVESPLQIRHRLTMSEGVEFIDSEGLEAFTPSGQPPEWRQLAAVGQPAPRARFKRPKPRLEADIDTLARLDKDSLSLTRTVTLRTDRPLRDLKLLLPEGEEPARVESAAAGFEWKRNGQALELRFPQALTAETAAAITIESRKRLLRAWSGPRIAENLSLENLGVPDAVKVAGYTALDFTEAWRVAVTEARGLEERDARVTPVRGRLAWFGLREWALALEVERAEPVYSAEITAYALPRARSVEVEGEFALEISGAPLRSFQVKLPPEQAARLRVTSPLLAEQQFDAETGLWTLTLREEKTGPARLRFRLSLPAGGGSEEASGGQRFAVTLPRLEMPGARRFRGAWVVEANTDTELAFETRGMQPIDVLRAPPVTDYQPRHRLVAAFAYGTGEHALTLEARRHAHSELALLVVKKLRLTSVLSPDGSSRHEAALDLHHSGEQFVHLRLPEGARLLSAVAQKHPDDTGWAVLGAGERQPVKPVRGADGTLALPLPEGSASATVRVIYHLTGDPWGGAGQRRLQPVELAGDVPILSTDWRVHLPEGYSYDPVDTRLQQSGLARPPSVLDAFDGLAPFFAGKKLEALSAAIPLTEREFQVSPGVFKPVLAGEMSAEESLREQGIVFADGASASFDPATGKLVVRNTAAMLDQVETFLQTFDGGLAWEDRDLEKATKQNKNKESVQALLDWMQRLILPKVEFDGVSLEAALAFLRAESRRLDLEGKGVTILLETGDTPVANTISLSLTDVPLAEALRYVTELAGMKYKIEPHAVRIAPLSATNSEMYQRIFRVPPDFLTGHHWNNDPPMAPADPFVRAPPTAAALPTRRTAVDILKETGITFGEGATAVYNRATGQLIVRNTQAMLDQAEAYVGSLSSQAPAWVNDKSGLLPVDFDLPVAGVPARFHGSQAPEALTLRFHSWERQMAAACAWMLGGALTFALFGRRFTLARTLLAASLLTAAVPLWQERWTAQANAALIGWLAALACWLLLRLAAWVTRRNAVASEPEAGEEVAA